MVVYKVLNKITNMAYIGQTTRSIEDRWEEHCKPALKLRSYLSNAVQKYGKDNFVIEELFKASTQEELDSLEQRAIKEHNTMSPNGYNLRDGGYGGAMSDEAKEKIGAAARGRKVSKEHVEKALRARKANFYKHVTYNAKQAKCGHCKQWKDKDFFNKNKARASGVQSRCKICRLEHRPDFKRAPKA